jgi:hypothetical protein
MTLQGDSMDLNYTADDLAFRDQVAGWPREWGRVESLATQGRKPAAVLPCHKGAGKKLCACSKASADTVAGYRQEGLLFDLSVFLTVLFKIQKQKPSIYAAFRPDCGSGLSAGGRAKLHKPLPTPSHLTWPLIWSRYGGSDLR